jgi:colanic acid/amylovoran biosynthesis glycosyltransferase
MYEMKRIALIVPAFPKLSETFIVSKFLGLLAQGWDVFIVCRQSDPQEWSRFPELNHRPEAKRRVHVTWPHRPWWLAGLLTPLALLRCWWCNPGDTLRYLHRGWYQFGWIVLRRFYLDAELIKLKPDLVHFEFGALAVGREYLKELLNIKLIASFRGHDIAFVGLEKYESYYHDTWLKVDAIHFLSKNLWKQCIRRGCPQNKTKVFISPAINSEYFDPGDRIHTLLVGTWDRPLRILSVGRLHWAKGYEYALQSIKHLIIQGITCEYRIVGAGDSLSCLSFVRHNLDIDNIVHFMGALPRREVKAQMKWADLFLHAAVEEGFGNAVIEAQAMSLPVVCADAIGLPENVAHNETGFVVPRRSPEALAEKIMFLAQNPKVRQQMGLAGRQRVLAQFRLRDQVLAFDRFYQQVLNL